MTTIEEMIKKVERLTLEDVKKVRFYMHDDMYQAHDGYILASATIVSREDATDDEWELLPEYESWYSVELDDDDEAYVVKQGDILLECWPDQRLAGGYACRNPWAGEGLDSCTPSYELEDGTLLA